VPITHAHQNLHIPQAYSHTPWYHADASRSRILFPHHDHASLTLHVHNKARASHTTHAHYTRVSKAPHNTSKFAHKPMNRPTHHAHVSRSSITFTNRFHASISTIALTLLVHDKPARHTHSKRMSITNAYQKLLTPHAYSQTHAVESRSSIAFTQRVHASHSRISFKHCGYAPCS
jgi:hypothetical protein